MKKLTLYICLFFITLSMPLAYFILRAYRGIEQEEIAELQYFATTLFDEIEEELAALILREEQRAVDEYSYYVAASSLAQKTDFTRSSLSENPKEPYILGYFQNNPDGSFQTPLAEPGRRISDAQREVIFRLEHTNEFLNTLMVITPPETTIAQVDETNSRTIGEIASNIAEKYLDVTKLRTQRTQTGQAEQQAAQQLTIDQVLNIKQAESQEQLNELSQIPFEKSNFQVEVAPMQSLRINDHEILIFRRIVINNQVYRQGFVILVEQFLNYLQDTYFEGQPMAEFTDLRIELNELEHSEQPVKNPTTEKKPKFSLSRNFPRPFDFLFATITCFRLPGSIGRNILNLMRVLMGGILLLGLLAIYQSARTIVDLSERRALFVSSVTHELKTPLTNIRMYIEMLEQGIAPNREREEEYFQILGSETRRLSRLIDNVLEFSKLEKKQRRFNVQEGTFEDVIREVQDIMQAKLHQEGFTFTVEHADLPPFRYDREVMVQVLLNLIENSLKFGKTAPVKEITLRVHTEGHQVAISVSDTGPGIPRTALKKVFDDFYRVENELTQTTRGTGIGLALVKKFITALGGTVKATNNKDAGCTITISLPAK